MMHTAAGRQSFNNSSLCWRPVSECLITPMKWSERSLSRDISHIATGQGQMWMGEKSCQGGKLSKQIIELSGLKQTGLVKIK